MEQNHAIHGNTEYRFKALGVFTKVLHHTALPSLVRGGFIAYYQDGKRHRDVYGDDEPTVMYPDGRKKWYKWGKLHRENGPAATWPNGAVVYARNGKLHNLNGPAMISHNGVCYWFVNGKRITKEEFDLEVASLLV